FFGNVTETAPETDRVVRDVAAVQEHAAGRCLNQPGQHLRGRALAGAVWTEVADDFSSADFEAHVVDGGDAVESLDDVSRFQHGSLGERGTRCRQSGRWWLMISALIESHPYQPATSKTTPSVARNSDTENVVRSMQP